MQVQPLKQNKTILQCCFNPSPACLRCDCQPGSSTASPVSSWQVTTMNPAVYIVHAYKPQLSGREEGMRIRSSRLSSTMHIEFQACLGDVRRCLKNIKRVAKFFYRPQTPSDILFSLPRMGSPIDRKYVKASKRHKRPKFSAQMLGESSIPHLGP